MRRAPLVLVALAIVSTACASVSGAEPQSEPTGSIATSTTRHVDEATTSVVASTAFAASTSEAATTVPPTVAPSEATELTMYRPDPIRQGDQVIAVIQPVDGVVLDDSSVTLRIVEYPDGRFLEADLAHAVVPESAALWTTKINGWVRGMSTARQGSTLGFRVDRDVHGDSFTVTFSATTAEGEVLATTGEIEIVG